MTATNTRIELAAVRALNNWEATFSDCVRKEARRIAGENNRPELITVSDYQIAAAIALQHLTSAVSESTKVSNHGEQKAA